MKKTIGWTEDLKNWFYQKQPTEYLFDNLPNPSSIEIPKEVKRTATLKRVDGCFMLEVDHNNKLRIFKFKQERNIKRLLSSLESSAIWEVEDQTHEKRIWFYYAYGEFNQYDTEETLFEAIASGCEAGIFGVEKQENNLSTLRYYQQQFTWFHPIYVEITREEALLRIANKLQKTKHQHQVVASVAATSSLLATGFSISELSKPTMTSVMKLDNVAIPLTVLASYSLRPSGLTTPPGLDAISALFLSQFTHVTASEPTTQTKSYLKTFSGGINTDSGRATYTTLDGSTIIAGYTQNFGAQGQDVLVAKLLSNGTRVWATRFGGTSGDRAFTTHGTGDGGTVVAGFTYSFNAEGMDVLVAKLSGSGVLAWAINFGGGINDDYANAAHATADGGTVVSGATGSFGAQNKDAFIAKVWGNGTLAWAIRFGGSSDDELMATHATADGGTVVAGYTTTYDPTGDVLMTKLSSTGAIAWAIRLGGISFDFANAAYATADNGTVVAGYTQSFGAQNYDAFIAKVWGNGTLAWATRFGGSDHDYINAAHATADGGMVVAGYTASFGVQGNAVLLAKLLGNGTLAWTTLLNPIGDVAYAAHVTVDGDMIVTGNKGSSALLARFSSDGKIANCSSAVSVTPLSFFVSPNISDITTTITVNANFVSPNVKSIFTSSVFISPTETTVCEMSSSNLASTSGSINPSITSEGLSTTLPLTSNQGSTSSTGATSTTNKNVISTGFLTSPTAFTSTSNGSLNSDGVSKTDNTALIAGLSVGFLCLFGVGAGAGFYFIKKRKQQHLDKTSENHIELTKTKAMKEVPLALNNQPTPNTSNSERAFSSVYSNLSPELAKEIRGSNNSALFFSNGLAENRPANKKNIYSNIPDNYSGPQPNLSP